MSQAAPRHAAEGTADVIVVGAGPAGSATAAHLAQAGLDVLVLEKATFPTTPTAATTVARLCLRARFAN